MISDTAHPRLASKVRLRFDRHAQRHMLLYPERGMVLNASAAAIAQLCTGEHSVAQIVMRLEADNSSVSRPELTEAVQVFLSALLERGLLRIDD
jgi:pyrroloquinoline quinone biosynthesis protein D